MDTLVVLQVVVVVTQNAGRGISSEDVLIAVGNFRVALVFRSVQNEPLLAPEALEREFVQVEAVFNVVLKASLVGEVEEVL